MIRSLTFSAAAGSERAKVALTTQTMRKPPVAVPSFQTRAAQNQEMRPDRRRNDPLWPAAVPRALHVVVCRFWRGIAVFRRLPRRPWPATGGDRAGPGRWDRDPAALRAGRRTNRGPARGAAVHFGGLYCRSILRRIRISAGR